MPLGSKTPYVKPKKGSVVYLKVPFDDKDEVKSLGARWDPDKKSWYCNKSDIDKFNKWSDDKDSDFER